jgi:hypothetical protein
VLLVDWRTDAIPTLCPLLGTGVWTPPARTDGRLDGWKCRTNAPGPISGRFDMILPDWGASGPFRAIPPPRIDSVLCWTTKNPGLQRRGLMCHQSVSCVASRGYFEAFAAFPAGADAGDCVVEACPLVLVLASSARAACHSLNSV